MLVEHAVCISKDKRNDIELTRKSGYVTRCHPILDHIRPTPT